ncbi:MAG: ethanolamine ammonia-lyase reactivating factor EutA [Rhodospirillales bacterium]
MTGGDGTTPVARHTLADHALGADWAHVHDGTADHEHDIPEDDGPIEENPIWLQDHVFLSSVGMDIGSSGTQVIFSRLELRRRSVDLSSRYFVVSRETVHESPVALTPYQSETRIDEQALGLIIGEAYEAAGMRPVDVDTGAVILTGEALRRENAEAIAAVLSAKGGEFVCATAGHHMEARLAAFGSGAARRSFDEGRRILNIDLGGGTTKLGLVEGGKVIATAAIHIGGRLQVVDADGRIVRLDPMGRTHAARAGFDWSLGDAVADADLDRVADGMAHALIAALGNGPVPHAVEHMWLTDPIRDFGRVDGVMFSGGVAEYVYRREDRDFGDMGRRLGHAVRARLDKGAFRWPLLPAGQCIRATALGASEYSIQLSGNTGHISTAGALLPRRNLPVVAPPFDTAGDIDADALAAAIRRHRTGFDLAPEAEFVLALSFGGAPAYQRVAALARGIAGGLADRIAAGRTLHVMLDGDVAQTVGAILRDELGVASEMLVVDGVTLWDFDYVDLGKIRLPSMTVPVTIKSLVFTEQPVTHDHRHDGHEHHGHGHHHGHHHHHGHGHHHHGHHHHHDHGH